MNRIMLSTGVAVVLAIPMLTACGMWQNDFRPITLKQSNLVVRDAGLVTGCEELKPVSASNSTGGLFYQEQGMRRALAQMLEAAESAGGNVIHLKRLEGGFLGATGEGTAYKCGNEAFQRLWNAPGVQRISPLN